MKDSMNQPGSRMMSIDILRALNMILMIFVNDLWSLKDIPSWLGHVESGVDGMGLADTVFPAFLFIVGLSLPFAIEARHKKGDSHWDLIKHVLFRSFALLVIGVFLVNGETYNAEATGMARVWWNPMCCICFILIWNNYPESVRPVVVISLRTVAIAMLVVLAFIYRGGSADDIQRFAPQWWGILGLIGWAYLASGLVTILFRGNGWAIAGAWCFFALLSMIFQVGMFPKALSFIPGAIAGGTLTGLTMGGVLTSLIFQHYVSRKDNRTLTLVLVGFAMALFVFSILTRPYWGLSKLGATPAWLFLCSALTILALLLIYWMVDVWGKGKWFNVILPAGTGTLLCYLIPYFVYALTNILGIHPPELALVGWMGLLKSFLFAILCAVITGLLMRMGLRLKI